jgi:hypothetical protein
MLLNENLKEPENQVELAEVIEKADWGTHENWLALLQTVFFFFQAFFFFFCVE